MSDRRAANPENSSRVKFNVLEEQAQSSYLWTHITVNVRQSLGPHPQSLPGCSPQSVQAPQLEFHTVIFVLKDTMPCQDCYQGVWFHWLLPHKGKWPFALTLASLWQTSRLDTAVFSLLHLSKAQARHPWKTSICACHTCRLVNHID